MCYLSQIHLFLELPLHCLFGDLGFVLLAGKPSCHFVDRLEDLVFQDENFHKDWSNFPNGQDFCASLHVDLILAALPSGESPNKCSSREEDQRCQLINHFINFA